MYGAVLLANPVMAAECGSTPGRLKGLDVLDPFRPVEAVQVERIAQALRLRHRSRYQVSVRWDAPGGRVRHGELTADPVSDSVGMTPALLVILRVLGEETPARTGPSEAVTPVEARILALLAGGATTARAARETGLTPDGVSYHLRRLSARWGRRTVRSWWLGLMRRGY